jgi:hypothetical protein
MTYLAALKGAVEQSVNPMSLTLSLWWQLMSSQVLSRAQILSSSAPRTSPPATLYNYRGNTNTIFSL